MTRPCIGWICAAMLTALSGCAVDQDREVAIYRQVIRERFPATAPVRFEGAVTLLDALSTANAHSEVLALDGETYLQALIEKERAFWFFFPTLSLAPTYSFQTGVSESSTPGAPKNERFDAPLTGAANLFNGFRDLATLRRAGWSAEQQRHLLADAQDSLLLNVAQAYYRVLRAERSVVVLENSLAVQDERLRDAEARVKAEVGKPLDVAQSRAQAAATRVRLIQARSDVVTGRELLSFLIGRPVRRLTLSDRFAVPRELAPLAALQAGAEENRSDLRAAHAGVQAAQQNVANAVGRYYPSLSVNLSYFLSRDTTPTDVEWVGLFSANLPIFSAGQIEAAVRTAWSGFRQARLAQSLLRRQVDQEVALAYEAFRASGEQLVALRVQKDAADEAVKQAQDSQKVGLATNLDVLAALDAQQIAALGLVNEEYGYKVFYLSLVRTTGQLPTAWSTVATSQPASSPTTTRAAGGDTRPPIAGQPTTSSAP
jgi:outer membrane protein